MTKIDLTKNTFNIERSLLRKEIINLFLEEKPGKGKGDLTSKYQYVVLKKGEHEVYLKRPAQFNNGFDFTLNVSNINFNKSGRATTRPTHGNIIDDLKQKKQSNKSLFVELLNQIDKIYNCQVPDKKQIDFEIGLDSEILLECIKWLFIEQDVTYWNYSGRAMFYSGIKNI